VGAFFVSAICLNSATAACLTPSAGQEVRVERVVDGDTLKLADGRSVRLIGVNAPELAHHGRPAEPLAQQAQQRLTELLGHSGQRVRLVNGLQARDHYGRVLAHAFDARGRNLEEQLLAEGLGFMVALAPNVALADCQAQAEQQARAARLGVWRRSPQRQASQLAQGGFALLQGKVERVERNRGGVWLEMVGPLVIQVPGKHVKNFSVDELDALAGRELEVRGWVIDRARRGGLKPGQARWLLQISHPRMLEVQP
jgi:endonuclease YncB( thermonuclease family)